MPRRGYESSVNNLSRTRLTSDNVNDAFVVTRIVGMAARRENMIGRADDRTIVLVLARQRPPRWQQ